MALLKYLFLMGSLAPLANAQEVPFKPSEDFEARVNLKFKQRPPAYDNNSFSSSGERLDKPKTDLLPFLEVSIEQLKVREEEVRVHVIDSKGKNLLKKKTSPIPGLRFEMGFVADLKKRDAAHEITLFFLSSEKKELSRIVLTVTQDGEFQVNGKWHGKF
ncbi:hypothetical protein WSM22_45260 [Cytophagales bacterium WSM2-2]|nr:hypothetical protein WSM22_45260 [Cytophagales bacterium WSM2-2]